MKAVNLIGKRAAGRVALVDDDDYEVVIVHRWRVSSHLRQSYAMTTLVRNGQRTTIAMHKLLTGWPLVDHKDHDGLNNQRSNLRPATYSQNTQNARPKAGHSSRYKGVTWHKKVGKWMVRIQAAGRRRTLGFFVDEETAARVYDAAAREAFGSYAYLNFEDSW